MKQRTLHIGKGKPLSLRIKSHRTQETGGLAIWVVALCLAIALLVMNANRQDALTRNATPAQEAAFHKEQARRLAALGISPVVTEGGVAYAEK